MSKSTLNISLIGLLIPIAAGAQPDVAVKSVTPQGTAAVAGESRSIRVELENAGSQALDAGDYCVRLSTVEDPPRRDNCSPWVPPPVTSGRCDTPPIGPGSTAFINKDYRFAQAGTFNLKARASQNPAGDVGSNNVAVTAVQVALPVPLICDVQQLSGMGGSERVIIKGNWFSTWPTGQVPDVKFNGVAASSVQLVSPLELQVEQPYICKQDVLVRVENATGFTTVEQDFKAPTLAIERISQWLTPDGKFWEVAMHVRGYRPRCTVRVDFIPSTAFGVTSATGAPFSPSILTRPSRTVVGPSGTRTVYVRGPAVSGSGERWKISLVTDYGTASYENTFAGIGRRR